MSITLYTAPDCLRCKIVKGFLAEHQIAYETVDFKADAQTFNTFYRANRKAIYRNPEGVEFPLFDDGTVIKQGSGEVIAYLLSGHALEGAVTRSDLLHGWISGLYLSQCPAAEEDHFVELVQQLAKGGLTVCIQTDGRNPALLERLIGLNALAKVQLNIPGPASVYEALYGSAPTKDELAKILGLELGLVTSVWVSQRDTAALTNLVLVIEGIGKLLVKRLVLALNLVDGVAENVLCIALGSVKGLLGCIELCAVLHNLVVNLDGRKHSLLPSTSKTFRSRTRF